MTATKQVSAPHRYREGWLIPSRTSPGTQYYVSGDLTRCSCRGFVYRGRCAHLGMVLEAQDLIQELLGGSDDTLAEGASPVREHRAREA